MQTLAAPINATAIPASFWRGIEPARIGERHLYAVQFETGVLKVGVALDPKMRVGRHVFSAAIHDRKVTHLWVGTPHLGADANEDLLIGYCRKRGKALPYGVEYFTGVTAERAALYGSRLRMKRAPAPPLPPPVLPPVVIPPKPFESEPVQVDVRSAGVAELFRMPDIAKLTGLNEAWLDFAHEQGLIRVVSLGSHGGRHMRRMTAQHANEAITVALAQAA